MNKVEIPEVWGNDDINAFYTEFKERLKNDGIKVKTEEGEILVVKIKKGGWVDYIEDLYFKKEEDSKQMREKVLKEILIENNNDLIKEILIDLDLY